jgi:hypothetical protein
MLRVMALLLPLLLAGCYLTKESVITTEQAEAIPGIEGIYRIERGEMKPAEVQIVAIPGSNVYQVRDPNAACLADLDTTCAQGKLLTMHGVSLGKDRYLVEVWDLGDLDWTGTFLFIAFDGKTLSILEPLDAHSLPESAAAMPELSSFTGEQEEFAKSRGLKLPPQATALTGPADAVLAFLKANATLKFKEHRLLVRER